MRQILIVIAVVLMLVIGYSVVQGKVPDSTIPATSEETMAQIAQSGEASSDGWVDVNPQNPGSEFLNNNTGMYQITTQGAAGLRAPTDNGLAYSVPIGRDKAEVSFMGITFLVGFSEPGSLLTLFPDIAPERYPDAIQTSYDNPKWSYAPIGSIIQNAVTSKTPWNEKRDFGGNFLWVYRIRTHEGWRDVYLTYNIEIPSSGPFKPIGRKFNLIDPLE